MTDYTMVHAARHELKGIWKYTATQWSVDQADKYHGLLEECCKRIAAGIAHRRALPGHPDIFLHHCERHYILFTQREEVVVILAFVHERMEMGGRIESILRRSGAYL